MEQRFGGGGGAEKLKQLVVVESLDQAVGAEEEDVGRLVSDGADLGFDKLVAGAEGFLEGGASRMMAGFAFVDLSLAEEPADVGVVVAELLDAALPGQVVDAAVADMAEVDPAGGEPAQTQGGLHAAGLVVAGADEGERLVDFAEEFGEDFGVAGFESHGRLPEGAGEEVGDFIDGDPAGEFPGLRAAHAVADGENEVGGAGEGFAGFPEVMNLPGVELPGQEGVLVVEADQAPVGLPGPFEALGDWHATRVVHGPPGGWWQTRNRSSRSARRTGGR